MINAKFKIDKLLIFEPANNSELNWCEGKIKFLHHVPLITELCHKNKLRAKLHTIESIPALTKTTRLSFFNNSKSSNVAMLELKHA